MLSIKTLRAENVSCNLVFRRVSTTTTTLVEMVELVETQNSLSVFFTLYIILLNNYSVLMLSTGLPVATLRVRLITEAKAMTRVNAAATGITHEGKSIRRGKSCRYLVAIFMLTGRAITIATAVITTKRRDRVHTALAVVAPITLRRAICRRCCSL